MATIFMVNRSIIYIHYIILYKYYIYIILDILDIWCSSCLRELNPNNFCD